MRSFWVLGSWHVSSSPGASGKVTSSSRFPLFPDFDWMNTRHIERSYASTVHEAVSTTLHRVSVGTIFKMRKTGKSSNPISSACPLSTFGTYDSRTKSRGSALAKTAAASVTTLSVTAYFFMRSATFPSTISSSFSNFEIAAERAHLTASVLSGTRFATDWETLSVSTGISSWAETARTGAIGPLSASVRTGMSASARKPMTSETVASARLPAPRFSASFERRVNAASFNARLFQTNGMELEMGIMRRSSVELRPRPRSRRRILRGEVLLFPKARGRFFHGAPCSFR